MNEEVKQNKNVDEEQFSISKAARKSLIPLAFVMAGWGINSSEIISGATISAPLGLKLGVAVVCLAALINALIGICMTIPGVKTGLGFAVLSRHTFGNIGSKVPSAVISVVHFGWYGILTALLARVTVQILPQFNYTVVAIIFGLAISVVATVGIKATQIIGYLAVPTCLLIGIVLVVRLVTGNPIDVGLTIGEGTFTQSLSQGIGAFAVGSLLACDVSRFAKNKKAGAIGTLIGLFGGLAFVRVLGTLSVLSTGETDIVMAFAAMGMAVFAFIFLSLNIVSTTDNILYSTGLSLSNTFSGSRKLLTMIAGVLGTAVAVFRLDNYFGSWLNFLAAIIPAIAGVVIADFYFVKGRKYCDYRAIKCAFNPWALVAWGIGIAWGYIGIWCQAIDSLLASAVSYFIIMLIIKKAKPDYYNYLTNAGEPEVNVVEG